MYIVVGTPHVYRVQVPPLFRSYDRRALRNAHGQQDALNGRAVNPQEAWLEPFHLIGVTPNRERNLFLLWSSSTFYLWNCRPAVQLFALSRSPESVAEYGENVKVIWKADSSAVAVATDKSYLLFFNIELERSSSGFLSGWTGQKRFEKSNLDEDFLPWTTVVALQITPAFQVRTDGIVEDFCCIREEIVVALSTGAVQRISWSEGLVNFAFSFNINDVPFGLELQHFRGSILSPSSQHTVPKTFVKSVLYSSLLAGFVITLADGRAGFITSPTLRFEPNKLQAVWAREVQDATGCQSVNNYYRLLCYGLNSGRVAVYCIGELTGSLDLVQRMEVSPADCPDAHARCGPVASMVWSPDERVLAVAWQKEGLAVYSVFGSLLFFSLTSLPTFCAPIQALQGQNSSSIVIKSLDWSPEGYQLWLVPSSGKFNFGVIGFAKSALTRNPCESNHLHVLMQSDDCLYVGLVDRLYSPLFTTQTGPSQQQNVGNGDSGPALALSVVPITPGMAYLSDNWPIQFSCISETGDWLAVAGRAGLACFSLKRRQWKLFGNISQERDFVVSGGLVLWREFVVAICYNVVAKRDELRFYPLAGRLDNASSTLQRLETQALLLNCVQDMLIIFGIDSVVSVFFLRKRSQSIERHKLVEINIGQFLAHPLTVTHITLTTLSTDIVLLMANQAKNEAGNGGNQTQIQQKSTCNSVLVTTSGRVLLLQADRAISSQNSNVIFSTPVRIAENVEHLWLMACDPINNAALAETIWLYCGRNGANVWLPLVNSSTKNYYDARSQAFLSKRVMLQVDCPIYPLTALLSVAAVVGAASETTASAFLPFSPPAMKPENSGTRITRFEAIRTSHSYLPSILRQLLRRHLGLQALEVTRSWSHLPNFPHVLELLLHQVVDEEAMSKEPLPDPLLPRVVAFIQQFPEHSPAVVVQCARKMEAVLWPYLFATVGPPRDLFADCLRRQDLDTAVSYLIILHTTEQSSAISRQLTAELLTAVLEAKRWSLAQDILRFLRSIGSSCQEPPPYINLMSPRPTNADQNLPPIPSPIPLTPSGSHWRGNNEAPPPRGTPPPPSQSRENLKDEIPVDIDLTERVVLPFLRKLVLEKRLLDLGRLAAAVQGSTKDFVLSSWLSTERQKTLEQFRLTDFVGSLHRLHGDFEWPYPVLVHPPNHAYSFSHSNSYTAMGSSGGGRLSGSQSNLLQPAQPSQQGLSPMSGEPTVKFRIAPPVDDDFHVNNNSLGEEIELVPKFTIGNPREMSDHVTSHTSGDNNSDSGSIASLQSLVSADGAVAVPPPNNVQVLTKVQVYRHEQHLRFLFRVMIDAKWYDWALLFSIILRDAKLGVESVRSIVALMSSDEANNIGEARCVNSDEPIKEQTSPSNSHNSSINNNNNNSTNSNNNNNSHSTNPAIVAVVRDICLGFSQFVTWAAQACPGYLAFAHVMDPQIRRLSYLLAQSPATTPPISRSESPKPSISVQIAANNTKHQTVDSLLNSPSTTAAAVAAPSLSPVASGGGQGGSSTNNSSSRPVSVDIPGGAQQQDQQSRYGADTSSSLASSYVDSVLNPEDHLIAADQQLHNPQQSNCLLQ